MKMSAAEVRKWVQIISDDYMHYTPEEIDWAVKTGQYIDGEELPDGAGVIGYIVVKDFDCKKKLSVVLLYCKPEYRGKYLRYMMRRIEEIAKQEGASKIAIGSSISGYKEKKFDRMLEYFGYRHNGYIKEI